MKKVIAIFLFALGAATAVPTTSAQAQEPFLGEIKYFAGNFAPLGWAKCDGQLLSISEHTALFSILGTLYGGDGRSTFGLPDARGRVLIHSGAGPGLSQYQTGARGGAEQTTLDIAQMPSHTHTGKLKASSGQANSSNPASASLAQGELYATRTNPDVDLIDGSVALGNTGGSRPFNNIQPYVSATCIIALRGAYPPRN